MTACIQYPQLKPHDPNTTRTRSLTVTLDAGDALLPATTLVPVDSTPAAAEIVGGDFTVEVLDMGLISASTEGDLWGISFKLHGGVSRLGEKDPFPLIRLRGYVASQPDEPLFDQTYQVEIRNL